MLQLTFSSMANAQIILAPTAIFMDGNQRIATLMVINKTNQSQEIRLDMKFGYARSDTFGSKSIIYNDSLMAEQFSLCSWVKMFPKKFTLAAGAKQFVRVMAMPKPSLPQGSYWGRLIATSSVRTPLATDENNDIGAQLNFTINQVVPVLYKNKAESPQLALNPARAFADSSAFYIVKGVSCTANPPFYGTVACAVYDANANLAAEATAPLTVYFESFKRFVFERAQLAPGTYTAVITVSPERDNIDKRFLLQMDEISDRWTFTVSSIDGQLRY